MLSAVLTTVFFASSVERALVLYENRELSGAAAALDQARVEDPDAYVRNHLNFLRGRIALENRDFARAISEFMSIAPGSPLQPLAVFDAMRAAALARQDELALQLLEKLPRDFPDDLQLEAARRASPNVSRRIWERSASREARYRRAVLENNTVSLWQLVREKPTDDEAAAAARILAAAVSSDADAMLLAGILYDSRQFPEAERLYQQLVATEPMGAEATYQLGRSLFWQDRFDDAVRVYDDVAARYPESSRAPEALYQAANTRWKSGDFADTERRYKDLLDRFPDFRLREGVTRNLIDVYRALNQPEKALQTIERALAGRPSAGSREVLLFSRAKIQFSLKRYGPALTTLRSLRLGRLRNPAGGTFPEEVRYFEGLCLERLGRNAEARSIWQSLAGRVTFYGQRAASRLGMPPSNAASAYCSSADTVERRARASLAALIRPIAAGADSSSSSLVQELLFLRQWSDAFYWSERSSPVGDNTQRAHLAYLAGRFDRALNYSRRLTPVDNRLLYPAGFRREVCAEADKRGIDPLWLHAIIWQESKYNPKARSAATARGLMQFIPETAQAIAAAAGVTEVTPDRLYDPGVSVSLGAFYWSQLLARWRNPAMALAAYNGGDQNVARWKNKWPDEGEEFFVADIGFVETRRYVLEVFRARAIYGSNQQ